MIMKKNYKVNVVLGIVGLVSGVYLLYHGYTLMGISGSIVSGIFFLKGFGLLPGNAHPHNSGNK